MDITELKYWYDLTQEKNLKADDYQELIRLNHLIMEVSHKIHNDNMLSK